jgi:hypothetical protein
MRSKEWTTRHTNDGTAVAEGSHCSTTLCAQPSPAAPAGRKSAGIFAYIASDGTTVIRFSAWRRIVQHAQRLRQQGAPPAEIAAYLTHKARELDTQFGWLKRLWAARLQRVLRRLALQQGLPLRWDGKDDDLALPETLDLFAALPVSPKVCRAPPSKRKAKAEDAEDDADSHSERWFASVVPRLTRAPNFCLRVAG